MGVNSIKKVLYSIIFISMVLYAMLPNKPDIARYETFDDTPLITFYKDETIDEAINVSAQTYPYLYAKGGIVLDRNLHLWQVGEDVLQIKKALKKIGYPISTNSYIFDENMQKIVMQFQSDHDLNSDGIVGKATLNAINKILIENKMTAPTVQTIVTNAPTSGYWIAINKSSNTLTLFKGEQVIEKFPVATGKEPKLTPEGKWKINNKVINPAWKNIKGGVPENPLGYRWLGLNIGDGYIYGIHGTNNENSIGYYVSKGCIRMENEDVNKLFSIVKNGTPVWIGNQKQLSQWGIVIK